MPDQEAPGKEPKDESKKKEPTEAKAPGRTFSQRGVEKNG